jgi:hypothetical protein
MCSASYGECACGSKAGVDGFAVGYGLDFIDSGLQGQEYGASCVGSEALRHGMGRERKARGAPSAVAARCSEACYFALDDGYF